MLNFKLISLIPFLKGVGKGHDFVYNRSVMRAAAINGWGYAAAIPVSIAADKVPEEWEKVLPSHILLYKKGLIFRLIRLIHNCIALRRFIHKKISSDRNVIFIESFDPSFLFALVVALSLLHKKHLEVWLLYRSEKSCKGFKGVLYKRLTLLIHFLVGRKRLKILADSKPLVAWFSSFFRQKVYLVPIPHTNLSSRVSAARKRDQIICWVPGRQNQKAYNRLVISHLSKQRHSGRIPLLFVIGERWKLQSIEGGVNVRLIPNVLSADEYQYWIQASNIVLLPYDPALYTRSTSGVFVECICAGGIPIVTRGTWMASELSRFGLEELSVDWTSPGLLAKIETIAGSLPISKKLTIMRRTYLAFHNEDNFSRYLRGIANLPKTG
ncbi:MAG TPA: hypothetical protein ENH70_01035 [Desulfobacteraceae bacterium]|nr:hypothetical protein [Desulfobacteraceae bacterium]